MSTNFYILRINFKDFTLEPIINSVEIQTKKQD